LRELLQDDPEKASRLAILGGADMWLSLGYEPVPDGLIFRGVKDVSQVDMAALEERSKTLASRLVPVLEEPIEQEKLDILRQQLQRYASLVANNLGVMFGDAGDDARAWAAYQRARAYMPNNISALLNLGAMVEKGHAFDGSETISQDLEELKTSLSAKFRVWSLSSTYGYVRLPQVYAQLGWTWAQSGDMKLAKARLQQASNLFDPEEQSRVRHVLARVHLMEGEVPKSVELYNQMLAQDPKDLAALRGLIQAYGAIGEIDRALEMLACAEAAGMDKTQVLLKRAQLFFQRGENKMAEKMIDDLLLVEPDLLQGMVLKAELLLARQDKVDLQRVLRKIEQVEGYGGYYSSYLQARQAMQEHDFERAQEFLEAAWKSKPRNMAIAEWVLQLAVARRDQEVAEYYSRELVTRDPDNAIGRYVLATLQIEKGEEELAKSNLRRCLKTKRLPAALNDLAWLLQEEGKLDEAEALAREAVEATGKSFNYVETLGSILLKKKSYDEARTVLEQALVLNDRYPRTHLYLAEVLVALGQADEARTVVERIVKQRDQLTPEQDDTLMDLVDQLNVQL
jgi:tetratricopeptide (TPR) repeat protein